MSDWKWSSDPESFDVETGDVGIGQFGNAIQIWTIRQGRPQSVAEAARAFNVPAAVVIEAVEWHPWMLTVGPPDDYERLLIEHDGE